MRGLRMSLPPPLQQPAETAPGNPSSSSSGDVAAPVAAQQLDLLRAAHARVASLEAGLRQAQAALQRSQVRQRSISAPGPLAQLHSTPLCSAVAMVACLHMQGLKSHWEARVEKL